VVCLALVRLINPYIAKKLFLGYIAATFSGPLA
jgi:hypothetical protein